jgi:glycosyltransferase involved in cell wall biosynthesis
LKRISVAVTNDLIADNRVHRTCLTLAEAGYEVILTGRKYRDSPDMNPRAYEVHRMHLLFRRGPLFYAEYNFRMFFRLLFSRPSVILANDLDTLPGCMAAALLTRTPVVYDSHEYFTEVPELVSRPRVQKVWKWLEKILVPRVKAAYTVCDSIAEIYTGAYGIPFEVVRNLPFSANREPGGAGVQSAQGRPVIIYQGALNLGRGLENAIKAMEFLPEADLILAGSGDRENELKKLASRISSNNVFFKGRLPIEELVKVTRSASLGISIEEDCGLNYRYALPNKLFDYLQAGIPVVVSNLPEMKKIVEEYQAGLIARSNLPEKLAETFRKALFDHELRKSWKPGILRAAGELTWENEKGRLLKIFNQF